MKNRSSKKVYYVLACLLCMFFLYACGSNTRKPKVVLSVWGGELDQEILQEMVDGFAEYYKYDADFEITVCEESEGTCSDTVKFAPEYAGDIYTIPDDQFMQLADMGAVMEVPEAEASEIIDACGGNDAVGVLAASYKNKLYAYPLTASNGYFLYYNSKYFDVASAENLNKMIEIARENNKKVAMQLTSGWYTYSFFKGAGMDVTIDDTTGKNVCDFNGEDGVIRGVDVAMFLNRIANDPGFIDADNDAVVEGVKNGEIIAAVSGTWNENVFKESYGDNYRATKLPFYNTAGKDIQMHSVMGYKLIAVNNYTKEPEWANKLAAWLTNEGNQLLRFEERGEGPANVHLADRQEIKASAAISALSSQAEYGHLQRVAGSYWDPMYQFGIILSSGIMDEKDMQQLLDDTVNKIED